MDLNRCTRPKYFGCLKKPTGFSVWSFSSKDLTTIFPDRNGFHVEASSLRHSLSSLTNDVIPDDR